MCFGVGFFGCGSGCVHVVAPPRRSFLIVRVAFFPVWVGVARCSAKEGACKLMGADGEPTPHFGSLAEGEAFLAERDAAQRGGFTVRAVGGSERTREYPTARELSARQMRVLTDSMRDALEAYSSSAALDVNKYLKQRIK